MSSGGIFKLITNNGLQDKLLMASEYLSKRLKNIEARNRESNIYNSKNPLNMENSWLPDMNDISKTHILFINGAYKPYVASGFEYNKCQPNGDIQFNSNITFTLPVFGDFINDCVIHLKLSELSAINPLDRVRYIAFPGHRICKKIEFKVNSNPLDQYCSDNYNAYYEFQVPANKRIGWMRNMGQEIPQKATITYDPLNDMYKEYKLYGDGNQTFKQVHNPIELWIPLLFWFKDIKNSIPNALIPYGQTNINISLAPITDIVSYADYGGGGKYNAPKILSMELYMNNIFLQPEVLKIFMCKFGFSLIRVHCSHRELLTNNNKSVLLNQLKWPTETLYVAFKPIVNNDLSQYWYKNSKLTKFTVQSPGVAQNINQTIELNTTSALLNSVILYNNPLTLVNVDNYYNGYNLVIMSGQGYNSSNVIYNRYIVKKYEVIGSICKFTIDSAWLVIPDATTVFNLYTPQLCINSAIFYKETPSVDQILIKAHDVNIFSETDESFYNSYLPYRFGTFINTPEDRGWYMLNFNYLPNEHQPSGHINISKAREFYINYTSSFISKENQTELIVLAYAINFLLIKDGTAALRYTT
jgi:hypothetical protein